MRNKRTILLSVLFMLSIGNFFRITGAAETRPIIAISLLTIGALTALLLKAIKDTINKA